METLDAPAKARPVDATVERLNAIPDVRARAAQAAKAARAARATTKKYRLHRNMAALTLLRPPHNWPKVRVVKHLGITRTVFKEIVARQPAVLPAVPNPEAAATRWHAKVQDSMADETKLLAVRDAAIIELLFGPEFKLPNSLVAEITGENQVRIAQLRARALPR